MGVQADLCERAGTESTLADVGIENRRVTVRYLDHDALLAAFDVLPTVSIQAMESVFPRA